MATQPRKRRYFLLGLFLLIGVILFVTVRPSGSRANLVKMQEIQKQLSSAEGSKLSPEEKSQMMKEMRDLGKNLSPDQRKEMSEAGRKRFEEELKRYVQLPKKEQLKYVDEKIDREENFRKQMNSKQGTPFGMPTGSPPTGLMSSTSTGKSGPGDTHTAEEKEKMRKARLDQTTPEFRALMDRFRHDMEARRQQRGLPPAPGPMGKR